MERSCIHRYPCISDGAQHHRSHVHSAPNSYMSITLVGTSSDGSIIVKYVGDKNLYVNPAESGQYDPPADLLEGALKYGASAESNAKAAAAAATSAAGSAAAAETNATNAAASATAAAQSAATIDVEQLKSQIMTISLEV